MGHSLGLEGGWMNHQGIIRDEGQIYICPFFLLFNIAVLSKSLILIRR